MESNVKSYTAIATAQGGRSGSVKSSDGVLDLKVSVPIEFGGEGGSYTNPEQLFAAGWAACFDSALGLVANARKVQISSVTTAEVTLGNTEDGGIGLSAVLKVKIEGVDKELALKLLDAAHRVCPYSKATRNNIKVDVLLVE
jgi:Ohr subfamily peroxiredoxin